MWKKKDVLLNKVSVPSTITLEKPHMFKSSMIELPLVVVVSPLDFPDTFDRNRNNEVNEINKIFKSNLKDVTFFHYMDQPKSMLRSKPVRNFLEADFGDFDYNRLPKCFRHIST